MLQRASVNEIGTGTFLTRETPHGFLRLFFEIAFGFISLLPQTTFRAVRKRDSGLLSRSVELYLVSVKKHAAFLHTSCNLAH